MVDAYNNHSNAQVSKLKKMVNVRNCLELHNNYVRIAYHGLYDHKLKKRVNARNCLELNSNYVSILYLSLYDH